MAERMITLGKREGVHARRLAARYLPDRTLIHKLFVDIAPKFAGRNGGYTRVLRIANRRGDNAEMAMLQLVGIAEEARKTKEASKTSKAADTKKKGSSDAGEKDADADAAKKAAAKAQKDEAKRARSAERARTKAPTKAKSTQRKMGGDS